MEFLNFHFLDSFIVILPRIIQDKAEVICQFNSFSRPFKLILLCLISFLELKKEKLRKLPLVYWHFPDLFFLLRFLLLIPPFLLQFQYLHSFIVVAFNFNFIYYRCFMKLKFNLFIIIIILAAFFQIIKNPA